MPVLAVQGLKNHEWGTSRIRLHYSHRNGIQRYEIAKITNKKNNSKISAIVLGHDNDQAIYMDYDSRNALELDESGDLDFHIERVCWLERIWWYLQVKDPMIWIPAWLAVWSVALGTIGTIIGVVGIIAGLCGETSR